MSGCDTGWCGLVVTLVQWAGQTMLSCAMPWTTHSCPQPAGKPGLAPTSHLCHSFPSSSVQKALWSHRWHSNAWRWHAGPSCGCPDRAPPSQLGSEVSAIVCYWPKREKKPLGELPKSKRRCMRWLASATIHQDSAEMGLGNVFGNFIILWPFVIIDHHGFSRSSQQEMAPHASCSSWIALNRLLK